MNPNVADSIDPDGHDLTGKTLGNYVFLRRLGKGGMATVYLARQTTLGRFVAIKVLRPELAVDPAYVDRFHREARSVAALSQANIVQIIEITELDGLHMIVQEYVRGQNLRQYLNRNQVVEPILATSILRQVAAALQESGNQGIVHRDIKPENIMITATGEVKVTDFGLARVANDQCTDLTQIGVTMGTPLYMSPEQAEGSSVDVRSDLYSLGITSWQMFTGRPPFEGENALSVAVKHLKEDLPSLERLRPDLPAALCRLIHKLASKDPEQRFQTPAALIKELRTLEFEDVADWEQLIEKLSVDDLEWDGAAETQTRLQVTRQLATIMSGHFRPWWKSPRLWLTVVMMTVCGAGAGILYALNNPPDNLLQQINAIGEESIRKYESVERQYMRAYIKSWDEKATREVQEESWRSVVDFFPEDKPENTYFCRKARVQLGVFYLDYDDDIDDLTRLSRLYKAETEFNRLASIPTSDDLGFRAIGLAGKAIALSDIEAVTGVFPADLLPPGQEITDLFDEVEQLRAQLTKEPIYNPYLRQRLDELILEQFPILNSD